MVIDKIDDRGQRLVIERSRLELSQAEVGEIIKADKQSVYRYESNARVMRQDQLELLLEKRFDIHFLLTGSRSESDATLTELERDWLQLLNQCDPNQKQTLLILAKNFVSSFPLK
jgi:transcriptional regulator with XRE-family HTH domain